MAETQSEIQKNGDMTTIEKLNSIPKQVLVTREQYGVPEYDIKYNDYGYAEFTLDISIDDESVLLAYYQYHNGECYELWCVSAGIYTPKDEANDLYHGDIGECLEYCLDETIKHFTEHRDEYSDVETYSGYSYDK